MSLFQKINALVMASILFIAFDTVYAQEYSLKNPDLKVGGAIDFIQESLNKGPTRPEADLKRSESNLCERIDFIQAAFDKGQTGAMVWSYAWTVINGATAGVQTYQAIRSSQNRAFNIVGASESSLGLAVMMADPFHARSSGSDLRESPGSTPEEQKFKLEKAEKWLERNYKQEKLRTSWLSHVGVLALSLIGAGIVWHYDGPKYGLISLLSTAAGGELYLWTQPARGIKDYNDYHNKYRDAYNGVPEKKYFIAPSRNGFVVGVYF